MTKLLLDERELHAHLQTAPSGSVWGYVRVSSAKQEDGQSPEAQRDEIVSYCMERGLPVPYGVVQEAASAGSPLFSITLPGMKAATVARSPRPLLTLLLASLVDMPKSHLVVWKLDRLARIATEQDLFLTLLRRHHVQLHTAYAGERHLLEELGGDTASQDPIRTLTRQILASFAEYERHIINMRMLMGTRKKAANGGWVGGSTPFGYVSAGGELVVHPEQAKLVHMVFYLRDSERYTYRMIAEVVAAQDVGGRPWDKVRVLRVLRNRDLYQGVYTDPYGVRHARPDLRILPENWGVVGAQASDLTPLFSTTEARARLS